MPLLHEHNRGTTVEQDQDDTKPKRGTGRCVKPFCQHHHYRWLMLLRGPHTYTHG